MKDGTVINISKKQENLLSIVQLSLTWIAWGQLFSLEATEVITWLDQQQKRCYICLDMYYSKTIDDI